ncbi:MAG: S-layer homology domain-containing protein [Syntrophothermus sp.]
MSVNPRDRLRRILLGTLLGVMILSLFSSGSGSSIVRAQDAQPPQVMMHQNTSVLVESQQLVPYEAAGTIELANGKIIKKHSINGPLQPPPGFEKQRQPVALPKANGRTTNAISLPGSNWVLGCSAGAAADIAAGQDQPPQYPITCSLNAASLEAASSPALLSGWTNLYAGPTNGGVMPVGYNPWSTWTDSLGDTYANNPLIASHKGLDGRTTRGTIDDYWVGYESEAPDPYITGKWTQHAWADAIGDYMFTSQSAYENIDGATGFYTYQGWADPLTCDLMAAHNPPPADGTLGRRNFYWSRGYAVTDCYNQPTDNVIAGGFSFDQLKAEIDAGQPVMLGLTNHSVVAVGYDTATKTVYIHDGWDYDTHSMLWGKEYSGMALQDVSIVHAVPVAIFSDVPRDHWAWGYIELLYKSGVTGGCSTSPLSYCPGKTVTRAQMAIFLLRAKYGSDYTPPAATGTFADVPLTDPAAAWIEQLASEKITGGCGESPKRYCPAATVTRAQMAIFLLRAKYGSTYTPPKATGIFLDVPKTDFTADWIEQLANEQITGGCGGGNYCPAKAVTRDQMSIFLDKTFCIQ